MNKDGKLGQKQCNDIRVYPTAKVKKNNLLKNLI
jgi:hypothetical protein